MFFKSESLKDYSLALLLITIGVFFRAMPHPDNFNPVTAIALLGGVTLPVWLALTIPLLIMIVSDFLIGFHDLVFFTWAFFVLMTFVGLFIQKNPKVMSVFLGAAGGSVLFFALSNLAVFLFENMYPKTWAGFVECFTMALPFFQNTLLGDLTYTTILFGLFAVAKNSRRNIHRVS